MDNYQKECAERHRATLCFRRTEASIQHTEEEKNHEQEYEIDQQNRALDAAACDDVKKYLKSLAFTNLGIILSKFFILTLRFLLLIFSFL